MRVVEKFSGASYRAAEKFWVREFNNGSPSPNRGIGRDTREDKQELSLSSPLDINNSIKEHLEFPYETNRDLYITVLTAYSLLLLRLQGHKYTDIVVALDDGEALPLRLEPPGEMSFREFARATRQKIQQAEAFRQYAFFILTNPLRMAEYGGSCPTLETAYLVAEQPEDNLDRPLRFYPGVHKGIDLVLKVIHDKPNDKPNDKVNIQFQYAVDKYGQKTIEKLNRYLMSILKDVGKDPDILLKEITLGPGKERPDAAIKTHAAKEFAF
jgi:hypothetical protein